ncbi:hypothetical protein AMECASPLE_039204 [Ameca splendens]|uniref:Uncharacterized protein n=1 Tax=Ameca splendens TaxID=208324 RepID=A0ABV0Z8I9_9TELE
MTPDPGYIFLQHFYVSAPTFVYIKADSASSIAPRYRGSNCSQGHAVSLPLCAALKGIFPFFVPRLVYWPLVTPSFLFVFPKLHGKLALPPQSMTPWQKV